MKQTSCRYLSLFWLWQFNSFLWEIGFFCQKWARVLAGREVVLGERKGRQKQTCGKLFSFIPPLHTSCFKDTTSSFSARVSFMHESKLHADNLVSYKSMATVGVQQVVCVRHGSYWPNISAVLHEPQLCELHTMLWMWSIELWKFSATNFSHVFLCWNFLVPWISWWHICAVSVKPTVCGMRESLSSTRVLLLISDHIP